MVKRVLDFSFINQDVNTQLAQSREILDVVQRLQTLLTVVPPGEERIKLEESLKRLLNAASILTSNANSTSSNAALTIVSSTGSST